MTARVSPEEWLAHQAKTVKCSTCKHPALAEIEKLHASGWPSAQIARWLKEAYPEAPTAAHTLREHFREHPA